MDISLYYQEKGKGIPFVQRFGTRPNLSESLTNIKKKRFIKFK